MIFALFMRPEKTAILQEIKDHLEGSLYLILTDFTGLTVEKFSELRQHLAKKADARVVVVKNSFLRHAFKELSLPDLNGTLQGPTAVVFGRKDIAIAAKVIKDFAKEFKKPKVKGGILQKNILKADEIHAIADLPPLEILQAQLLGLLTLPATMLVSLLNTPASQLTRVLKMKSEKTT